MGNAEYRPGAASAAHPEAAGTVHSVLERALGAYHRQDYNAAIFRALEATRLAPENAQAFHVLALSLEGLGELKKSVQMLTRARALEGFAEALN